MVSVLVGFGKEPVGRRMTRPQRERLRVKQKTIAERESIFLEEARSVFECDFSICPDSFWFGFGWVSW